MIEYGRPNADKHIFVEFERDPSMRATEVVVWTKARNGDEEQGVKFLISDTGKFIKMGVATELIEGVDII